MSRNPLLQHRCGCRTSAGASQTPVWLATPPFFFGELTYPDQNRFRMVDDCVLASAATTVSKSSDSRGLSTFRPGCGMPIT